MLSGANFPTASVSVVPKGERDLCYRRLATSKLISYPSPVMRSL